MNATTATSVQVDAGQHPRRPGGRSARVQQAVYRAVGQLVGSGERETMTIPQVAELAGVNPTSIYRRWGSITALVEEVAVAALTQGEDLPDTGTLRGDLTDWAQIIAADIGRPKRRSYLRAMIVARDELVDECPCWEIRRDQAQQMVARAADRGEPTPTVEQILDHIIAPLYHHAVFGKAIDDAFAAQLVGDVLAMIA
ncbi:TetR/AcrR family transcriptional regulator [Gordonia oryzae]|uniref:TetR/AcrR family transcriptional regulator n=1 Tax=Gordonia oryzae TaxID=2487349 RepID=A0A3N4G408_9ACTN|nr:TetR/AcrR family transcriptional regulator [Gordonia oryzae]RPA57653.1 TetR/AcrR family transcriptional regulator [Gordonia oryzae]